MTMSEDNLLRSDGNENMEVLSKLQNYIGMVCGPILFEGQESAVTSLHEALITPECSDVLAKYIATSECSVLLVERSDSGAVKIGLDVRMPTTGKVSAYLAIIKAREAPIDAKTSLSNQIQVLSMSIDGDGETPSDEMNQSFFTRLHQLTRHYYAPLARSARNNSQVLYIPVIIVDRYVYKILVFKHVFFSFLCVSFFLVMI